MTGWRRPSACSGNGECIEVDRYDTLPTPYVGVRLSRMPSWQLYATRAEFSAFITAAKNGEYDDLTGDAT